MQLYGFPNRRRDLRSIETSVPNLWRLAGAGGFATGDAARGMERFLAAAAQQVEPRMLSGVVTALWALPPFSHLATTRARETKAAELWLNAYSRLHEEERARALVREPVAANTLRSARHKSYFAELLEEAVNRAAVQQRKENAGAYIPQKDFDPRPKLPVAVTLELRQYAWLDDEGRRTRVRFEHQSLTMAPTNGIHRMIVTNSWKGYRTEVVPISGCALVAEEELPNNLRRLVFDVGATQPGEQHTTIYELRNTFDEDAPTPDGGELFADEISDDFTSRLVVHFGARRPQVAWRFDDLPRPAVPSEPTPSNIIGLDAQNRLVWNFFPPTNARKCYGAAWRFGDIRTYVPSEAEAVSAALRGAR